MISLSELRKGDNPSRVLEALRQLCTALSVEEDPPIKKAVEFGFIPLLVHYLGSKNTEIQLQAASAITSICSGSSSETQAVVSCGSVPLLLSLVSSQSDLQVCEQVVWALGNIAGDSIAYRDMLNSLNTFGVLCQLATRIPLVRFFFCFSYIFFLFSFYRILI